MLLRAVGAVRLTSCVFLFTLQAGLDSPPLPPRYLSVSSGEPGDVYFVSAMVDRGRGSGWGLIWSLAGLLIECRSTQNI